MTESSIHRHFQHLDDPRLNRRKKYPLINLIFIAFCAVLCGAEDWVYFITSLEAQNVNGIAQSIREHWQVENSLHWRLDVSFNEDQWRSKLGNATANIAVFNKMALNLLKKETTAKVGIKNKRLMAGWDEMYLTKVIMCLKN